MEKHNLSVAKRPVVGSGESRRNRKVGKIPAVCYSKAVGTVGIEINEREFIRFAETSRSSQVFTFTSEDAALNSKEAIVKEVQRDFVNGKVLHVDFQILEEGTSVRVSIPVKVVGEPEGVKNQGGVLTVVGRSIDVTCLPNIIPGHIEVDVTALKLGDRLRAGDIKIPEGSKLKANPQEVIATVMSSRASAIQAETEAKSAAPAAAAKGAAPAKAAAPAKPAAKK